MIGIVSNGSRFRSNLALLMVGGILGITFLWDA
jgi:hypothetical protein